MHSLGIHFDYKGLKIALLEKTKKGARIELLRTFDLEANPDVKPLYILAPILAGKNVQIASGLEAWEVFIREISLKLTKRSALLAALPFQLEALIPFPLEELVLATFFEKMDKQTTLVSLTASRRPLLDKHLEMLKKFDIDPDQLSCTPAALWRFAQLIAPQQSPLFLFHLGEEKSTYAATSGNKITFSHSLNIGRKHFTEALQKEGLEEGLDLMQLEENAYPELFALTSQLQKHLSRVGSFTHKKNSFSEPPQLLLTGDFPLNLESFVKKSLDTPSCSLRIDLLEYDLPTLQSYAIPIGLGLEALANDRKQIQFRTGSYLPLKQKKKRKKLLTTYLSSALALTIAIGGASFSLIKKKEALLFDRLQRYSHTSFTEPLPDALESWGSSLAEQKNPFSYTLTAPKISDVLAWLSAHPKGKIEVKRLHYSLTKFPKIGMEKEGYEAKVDLEFTASSPRSAREFHDALLAGDELVNAQKEIAWNAHQESYQTSFYLKSRNRR